MNRRRAILTSGAALLPWRLYAQPVPIGGPAGFQTLGPGPLYAGILGTPPSLDMSFLSATLDASITWTRANNNATNGLFTDASGASFSTFLANVPRINTTDGLLIEAARTNSLLNSGVPVTQTTASLATGVWRLWVNGAGSATPSAVTAVGTGFAAATQGVPSTFTLTGAGTVLVTVSGALNRFQLETGADSSSYIPTVAAALTRQIDSGTLPTSTWFNANEGTVVADFMQPTVNATNGGNMTSLWTDSANVISLLVAQVPVLQSWVGNVLQGSMNITGAPTAGITQRIAYTYIGATKTLSACLNGGPVGFMIAGSLPSVTQIKFGAVRVNAPGGFTRRLRYYPRALQVPELRAVTAL